MPFSFRDPFPFSFGPQPTADYDGLEAIVKANLGDALSQDDMTATDADIRATTLMMLGAKRANDRRITQQIDPRTLTDPLLSRWESILLIHCSKYEPIHIRRARVASRLMAHYDATSGSISAIAENAFAPWLYQIHYSPLATAVMSWPGNGNPTNFTSTVAEFSVEYIRPVGATDSECSLRRNACRAALDEVCPAWVVFNFHETDDGLDFHWIVGVSHIGIAVIGDV
jgi:hypothetical protein